MIKKHILTLIRGIIMDQIRVLKIEGISAEIVELKKELGERLLGLAEIKEGCKIIEKKYKELLIKTIILAQRTIARISINNFGKIEDVILESKIFDEKTRMIEEERKELNEMWKNLEEKRKKINAEIEELASKLRGPKIEIGNLMDGITN